MNIKSMAISAAVTIVALIVYDMFVKKIVSSSYERD